MPQRLLFVLGICLTFIVTNSAIASPPEALGDEWQFVGEVLNQPGYDIWGSSPIRDKEGKVHLFCARWPGKYPFDPAWRTHSEIAHYVANKPEGPFKFVSVVAKGTGQGWNAQGFHNPTIRKIDGKYVLVFIANNGVGKHGPNQRIGMLISKSLNGPWKAIPDKKTPLLAPPEDESVWCFKSGCGVNNPSLIKNQDGRYHLYFKARHFKEANGKETGKGKVSMGVAIADKLQGPYVIQPKPITANTSTIEDGYAFHWRGHVCLMSTDNHGILEEGGGLLWLSKDGIHFEKKPLSGFHHFGRVYLKGNVPKQAKPHYTRNVKFERPQILMNANGEPEYLYVPSGVAIDGSDGTNVYLLKRKISPAPNE